MNEIKIETRDELKHLLRNIGTLPAGNYKLVLTRPLKQLLAAFNQQK